MMTHQNLKQSVLFLLGCLPIIAFSQTPGPVFTAKPIMTPFNYTDFTVELTVTPETTTKNQCISTNSRVSVGWALKKGEPPFLSHTFDGVVKAEVKFDGKEPIPISVVSQNTGHGGANIRFKSNAFPHGTSVGVTLKLDCIIDGAPVTLSASNSFVAYNYAFLYRIPEFLRMASNTNAAGDIIGWNDNDALSAPLAAFTASGYSIKKLDGTAFDRVALVKEMEPATMVYLNMHGSPTTLGIQTPDSITVQDIVLMSDNYARQPIFGVCLDACSTTKSLAFTNAFLDTTGMDVARTNRFSLGWNVDGRLDWCGWFGKTFWPAMTRGETVSEAFVLAQEALKVVASDYHDDLLRSEMENGSIVRRFGDPKATLNSVYENGGNKSVWFVLE